MAFDCGGGVAEEIVCVGRPEGVDDLNEAGYLDANPDVRKAGLSARDHFVAAGRREGRSQWMNLDRLAEMREDKLRLLRFRIPPSTPRDYGAAVNFLTPEIVAEFAIPESPPVSANQYGGPFIDEIRNNPSRLCLDVGAGLRHTYLSNVVNTDIYPSISTDVLCVGEHLPFESDQFDYAICGDVLEHTLRPWQAARELCRVLKRGGKLLVDYPFLQGMHGYPHHYFNATPQGAASLFESSCDILSSTIEPNNHPIHAIWWILAAWRHGLDAAARDRFESLTIGELLGTPADAQLEAPYCSNLAEASKRLISAGSTLIVRKKAEPQPDPVTALEAELAALRASRSWRLTAPLRAVSRQFARIPIAKRATANGSAAG